MSSDWKESAIKRRDFRSTKSDPEVPKHRKKKAHKKPWKVVAKNFPLFNRKEDYVLGRYKTEQDAKNALQGYKKNWWGERGGEDNLRIEKDD